MKTSTQSLITIGVAATAIALLAPGRLASQYASPVNVMNSKSAPALIRDTDNPRRTPYVSTVIGTSCNPECHFTPVPNNMRLVITHVDATVYRPPTDGLQSIRLTTNSFDSAYPEFTAGATIAGLAVFNCSHAVEYYAEPGSTPRLEFTSFGYVQPSSATLTGYLIDCTTGCAAIVH